MPSVFRRLWATRRARIRQSAATRPAVAGAHGPLDAHERDAGLMSWFGPYIGSMVYGGLDGIVTTFAVVSGVAGANLGPHIILILGIGNLIADGFSMATGDYLSTKSEREYYDREARRQAWEIERSPDRRRAALRALYQRNGYTASEADEMVAVQTRERPRWVRAMMINELGMMKDDVNPMRNAVTTFISFVLAGSLPLLAYLIDLVRPIPTDQAFRVSVLLSGLALFALGAAKVLVTRLNPLRSGLEMLLVGGLAATVAYVIGDLLQNVGR
jgi:VIT1/CCC1 family predicted Fe2+/Mn2+ transporter